MLYFLIAVAVFCLLLFFDIWISIKKPAENINVFHIVARYLFITYKAEVRIEKEEAEVFAVNLYKKGIKKKKLTGLKSIVKGYRYSKKLPVKERKAKSEFFKRLFKKAHIILKRFVLKIGTGDAFYTAHICGAVMIGLNTLFAAAKKIKAAKNYETRIIPVFDKEHLEADIDCIIHIKPVHIITGYLNLLIKRR